MVRSPVIGVQKFLNNGPIKKNSMERLLSVQFQCHISEQG